jgi:YfiH family protein
MSTLPLITPEWPAPVGVGAAMSTRQGGVCAAPFDSLNLRPAGLDAPGASPVNTGDQSFGTAQNITRWQTAIGVRPVFLRQVHGCAVANLDEPHEQFPTADAAVTTRTDIACTVLVADCLPVLFTDQRGRAVAAAHAGWRGLAAGVLEATVAALCRAAACRPGDVVAWMGASIGPAAFEVGEDVLQAFGVGQPGGAPMALFLEATRPDGSPRWKADLPGLALLRLQAAGLSQVSASGLCTVSDPSRFFSFRRDGLTGRMAASVWRVRA